MEIRFEKAYRVQEIAGENQSKSLKKYPALPNENPATTSMIVTEMPWEIEVYDAGLGLYLLKFLTVEQGAEKYTLLLNHEQIEDMTLQYAKIWLLKTSQIQKSIPQLSNLANQIEKEIQDIAGSMIVYVDKDYTEKQREYIDALPDVVNP